MRSKFGAVLALTLFLGLGAGSAMAEPYDHAGRDQIRQAIRDGIRQGMQGGPLGDHPSQLIRLYLTVALLGALMLTASQTVVLRRRILETEDLRRETQRLRRALEGGSSPPDLADQILAVRVRNGCRLVKPTDIEVVRAADDYCELVLLKGDRLLHAATIEGMARQLPSSFRRIHRSVIVNVERIVALRRRSSGGYEVMTEGGEVLPVGRSYLAEVRRSLT